VYFISFCPRIYFGTPIQTKESSVINIKKPTNNKLLVRYNYIEGIAVAKENVWNIYEYYSIA